MVLIQEYKKLSSVGFDVRIFYFASVCCLQFAVNSFAAYTLCNVHAHFNLYTLVKSQQSNLF